MALTTLGDFINIYCVEDGMLANAENVNRSPIQLKKELDEVNLSLNSTKNSKQVLDISSAIQVNGKIISIKKGDGSVESVTLSLFDTKMDKIVSLANRIPRFDGVTGNVKLSTSTIDDTGNLVVTGSITSTSGLLIGNASTSTKLQTARLIGGVLFDGTANISLPGVNVDGSQNTTGNASTSSNAFGTSFFTSGSGTENQIGVKLNGQNDVYLYSNATGWGVYSASGGSAFQYTRTSGTFNFNGNSTTATTTTGNSGTATKLQTARTISLGGVLSGTVTFDGSANVTILAAHTADPVITLTGAVTGAATMYDLGNVSITTTITNDSHSHDTRYYSKAEMDTRYVNSTGDAVSGSIYPSASGTIDLGLGNALWRYIWGTATSAQYADLAEKYETDIEYPIGSVLEIGGSREATIFKGGSLAGVVSENPGFRLNESCDGQFIALKGKVPVICKSEVLKGQYCIAFDGGVIGKNKKDISFEDTLNIVGVALEDSKNNTVMVKV